MLIQFSTSNYRSFLNTTTLNMEATSVTEFSENVFKEGRLKLNKSAVIYGANASGKSNFLQAMSMMRNIISSSFDQSSASELPFDPFLLKVGNNDEPSSFEVVFYIDKIKYRYGFELDSKMIREEWLFETEKIKERPLFLRIKDGIEVFNRFKEGNNLEEKTRINALFLTVVDQFNGEKASKIIEWFNNFNVISGISHVNYRAITFDMLSDEEGRKNLTNYFHSLDLGFEDIKVTKELFNPKSIASELPENLIKQIITDLEGETIAKLTTTHKMFDDNGNFVDSVVEFNARRQESSGTNKIIDLSGSIFETLKSGGVLVVDELDAKLHPLLTISIIRLFQNPVTNPFNAQLIFAIHSTKILGLGNLRRDQIYFTEKDKFGVSDLYSLVEYNLKGKKIRKDNSFEKDYIQGRYGAIPFIKGFQKTK